MTVALALLATTSLGGHGGADVSAEAKFIFIVAMGYVFATLFVAAPTLRPLMKFLKLDKLTAEERLVRDRVMALSRARVREGLTSVAQTLGLSDVLAPQHRKPLSSLTHEDLLVYQRFLADPQPAERWVMKAGRKWSRFDPDWRPFAGPLAPTSQRQAIFILYTMFSWLVNAGYLAGNPLSLSRHRQRKAKPRITRFLDDELWLEVKTTIETMPRETDREREHFHRVRWLFSLLYICGLRISEVIEITMGAFFCRRDSEGEERWWLEITGKGDKMRLVPATAELIVELTRYRRENGLSPFPLPGEPAPLLLPIGQSNRNSRRRQLCAAFCSGPPS